jgi:alpha-1,3/alpha-1,6-mannosyltransferase
MRSRMKPLRIAFVRPRLGVGGAERLVVDAARELSRRGHHAVIHAPAVAGAPQFEDVAIGRVVVRGGGGFLPTALGGRLRAPCAIVRAAWAALAAVRAAPDVVLCDVVAHVVPLLRRVSRARVVFYCHYPDSLLTPDGSRARSGYALYRRPLDALEARGLRDAHRVLVNSRFTAAALRGVVPSLEPTVVHPSVDVARFASPPGSPAAGDEIQLLCVARFDPRKGLGLALEALAALRGRLAPEGLRRVRLVYAGHLEPAWPESRATLDGLKDRARALSLEEQVRFVVSPSDAEVVRLLNAARAVVATAPDEHFGYVPLEAMAAGRPVVAPLGSGPAETIVDGETGRLRPPTADAYAEALAGWIDDPALAARMGAAGRAHVAAHFSMERLGAELLAALAPG